MASCRQRKTSAAQAHGVGVASSGSRTTDLDGIRSRVGDTEMGIIKSEANIRETNRQVEQQAVVIRMLLKEVFGTEGPDFSEWPFMAKEWLECKKTLKDTVQAQENGDGTTSVVIDPATIV